MSEKNRTFGYARVSTPDQSLAAQIKALEEAGCERVFAEKKSAAASRRPEYNMMMRHLRPGDTVIVWKLDRLGRDVVGLGRLIKTFEAKDIQLKSVTESLDTSTPVGKAFFYIVAALAEMERNLIRERTKAGIAAAQAKGIQFGRPTDIKGAKRKAILADLKDLSMTVRQVAEKHGYHPGTLHKHFPGERSRAIQEQARS